MENKISGNIFLLFAVSLTCAAGLGFFQQNDVLANDIVIISNKSVPDAVLTDNDIKNIFLGKKGEWSNGEKIIIATLQDSETHNDFLKKYIGKGASQYTSYWRQLVFTGKGKLPKSFNTEESLLDYIAGTTGAVGYVSSGKETGTVKTISVK